MCYLIQVIRVQLEHNEIQQLQQPGSSQNVI